jgi:hypothetical protein
MSDWGAEPWQLGVTIAIIGAIGGFVGSFLTSNGFQLPGKETSDAAGTIWKPGFFGNMVVGAVAAALSWMLYGPAAEVIVFGTSAAQAAPEPLGLTVCQLRRCSPRRHGRRTMAVFRNRQAAS